MLKTGVVILAVLASVPARADKASDAIMLLERGIEAAKRGDQETARELFLKARDLVPEKANPYRWLGIAEAQSGHCKEAVITLAEFLRRVPANDPRTTEAAMAQDRCKKELAPKVGTLAVESSPVGADVRLDSDSGATVGVTPYRNEAVPVGPHVLYLSKAGYSTLIKAFTVGLNESVRLDLVLRAESAVSLVGKPAGDAAATGSDGSGDAMATAKANERRSFKLPIGVGVAALAVLVVAAGLSGSALADYNHLNATCSPGCMLSEWREPEARSNVGTGFLIGGGALAVADVALWIWTASENRNRDARAASAPSVSARGARTSGLRSSSGMALPAAADSSPLRLGASTGPGPGPVIGARLGGDL